MEQMTEYLEQGARIIFGFVTKQFAKYISGEMGKYILQMVLFYVLKCVLIGALFGLLPFFWGHKKRQKKLAKEGFFCCMISGVLGIWLTVFLCAFFTYLILKKDSI